MASAQAEAIKQLMRDDPSVPGRTLEQERADAETSWPALTAEPEGVRYEAATAGGVPVEWAVPAAGADDRVLCYFHGGGYVLGSLASHRRLVGHLARAIGCRALAVDYRLAPEHPFPAAVHDSTAAYRALLATGVDPARVLLGGDSAGGGLALATLLNLRGESDPLPAGAVLLSPWTDLTGRSESNLSRREADVALAPDTLALLAATYLAGADGRDPLASPVYGDLAGLPPLCVHVGDDEVLLDDSTRLAAHGADAGVDVELVVWPELFHVFQMGAGNVPESDASIAAIAAWARPLLEL